MQFSSLINLCFWLSGALSILAMLLYLYIIYLAGRDKELWRKLSKFQLLYLSKKQVNILKVQGGNDIARLCVAMDYIVYSTAFSMSIFFAAVIIRVFIPS